MNQDQEDKMHEARAYLDDERVRYTQPSEHHLKVGPYNFWPNSGTIYLDGAKSKEPERGLQRFVEIIRKLKERNANKFEKKPERFSLRSQIETN